MRVRACRGECRKVAGKDTCVVGSVAHWRARVCLSDVAGEGGSRGVSCSGGVRVCICGVSGGVADEGEEFREVVGEVEWAEGGDSRTGMGRVVEWRIGRVEDVVVGGV